MAYGLQGEIENRMDAYRGNPAALQQKYAQSQELIDLLALQKLKSEKEAAARQMQMQMAQQQAAQGQPPTIKDQREQEVLGLTKQELAQQQSKTLMQKQQQQQANMQRLMQSGVAGLPAPNMARMAGGGIVAFAGEDGSFVEGEDKKPLDAEARQEIARAQMKGDREALLNVLRKLGAAGYDVATVIPRGIAGAIDTALVRPARAITGMEIPYLGSVIDTDTPTPAMDELRRREAAAKTPIDNRALLNQADAELRSAPAPTPTAPSAPAAAVTPPAPAAPVPGTVARPPAPAGVAGMIDPFAKQEAEEKRVAGLLGLTKDQRKVYDEGVASLRELYKEEMDPEARRQRQLSAFLRGAGGRSSFGSVMAGGSGASEAERQRSFAQRLKGTEAVQKKLEDVIGIERGAVKEGISAGQEAGKLGGQMRGQDIQSRDRALDREVEKAKVGVQAEANAALRDQTNFQRLQTTLGTVNRTIAQIAQGYAKSPQYGGQLSMLQMQLQGAKGEDAKKIQDQIRQLSEEMDAVVEQATADLVRQRDALEAAMGGGADTGGFTVRRKQ